jgi:predicted small lipoprotein YifL
MSRAIPLGQALRTAFLLLALGSAFAGCGQRGPLTLPASARPVEPLDPSAAAPAGEPAEPEEDERPDGEPAPE